jgi:hypothetical protein
MYLFAVGSVCHTKRFTTGRESSPRFNDDEEIETEARNWLRQVKKDLYAEGFDALVKRWNKYINFGYGYIEK